MAKVYHFHNHINGAPEELTNEAGEIVWQGRYESWGRLALQRVAENFRPDPGHEAVVSPQPLRMQGQYAEVETGLCYNTFRYYDPDIGRFISEDPIGLLGGPNLYAFAPNTDAWVDPWGWAKGPCGVPGEFKSRRHASREARRDAGVPMSQRPDRVYNEKTGKLGEYNQVPMTTSNGKYVLDQSGKPIWTREYHYIKPDGSNVVIQDHSYGHKFGESGLGDQGSHFNVRPADNTRTGKVPRTKEHYGW